MKAIFLILSLLPLSAYARAGSSEGGGRLLIGLIAVGIGFLASAVVGEKIVGKGKDTTFTMFVGFIVIAFIFGILAAIFK
jgi:hypothetical protein